MALANVYGDKKIYIGPDPWAAITNPAAANTTLDATNEAAILVGRMTTSDGGSHTIDTSGSSSVSWRAGSVTFANAGTTVKVGVAAVDAGNGPAPRAVNVADVITFDVSKSLVGGGGLISANAWHTHVPDTGTKTIANGDLVAVCIQMAPRAGSDAVNVSNVSNGSFLQRPTVTGFVGGSYAQANSVPNCFITFADGATGWIDGGEVFSTLNTRTWSSGDATKEYGQLFKLPFPQRIFGVYGWLNPTADLDIVLYSDPLGTPSPEKTVSLDANTMGVASARRFREMFTSPYDTTADQLVAAVFKPGGSNVSAYYKTLAAAGHRVSDIWGVEGYGVSRASGAFANANSSLDHYYIGLITGAYDAGGAGAAGGARIIGGTVVR
jgi:hypothetical protein